MIKQYFLTDNLILNINLEKYEPHIIEALKNKLDNPDKEDETGAGMFWDASNHILSAEIGWLENMLFEVGEIPISVLNIDNVLDELYEDIKAISIKLCEKKIK